MKNLLPVIWAKGTFLTPQHMQAQDRFLESLLEFRVNTLAFRPWGFTEYQIDRQALAGGNLAIARAVGMFPDGLPFSIPDADAPPPPKILEPFFEGDVTAVDLYLAIPPHVEGGLNVSMPEGNLDTRYHTAVMMLRDENTGLGEKPVQVASKNFRLLADSEIRHGMPAIKIARVERSASGLLQLDPQFVPPVLDLSASDYLVSILRRLIEIMVAKSGMLSGMRRQRNQSLADFTSVDIANFWLLYTVNSYLPALRHVFETRNGHPELLYSTLTALAGSLTTFSADIQPRSLPKYDHEELSECFTDLDEKLRIMLDTAVPSNVVSLPLKRIKPFIYATAIPEERFLSDTRLYLAVKSSLPQADLATRVPQLVKACSATHVEHLITHALPGAPLRHESNPPGAIPVKLEYSYFNLTRSGGAWEAILRARNFAVYVPVEIPAPEMELVVLLPND